MNEYKETLNRVGNMQSTENGAIGYSTSGKNLVDLNFVVPSNHNNVGTDTIVKFCQALGDDPVTTVKWLFYLRDIREGLGERGSFIELFQALYNYDSHIALSVLSLIPEYGRWKDLIDLLAISIKEDDGLYSYIFDIIAKQFKEDCFNMSENKSISLLAKWMPSINASSKSRNIAKRLARHFCLNYAGYRKILSTMREYIDVTERKTCANKWGEIDYNKVSSNANARYVHSFMKHDEARRQVYLDSLVSPSGSAVMHATNLYPHEVYAKYNRGGYVSNYVQADPGIEALWSNLKQAENIGNVMVVVDGSGSMETHIAGSSIMAIDVSRSIGAYFAERANGVFKNKLIEFSERPRYIDLSNCKTLADKYNTLNKFDDCSNTNLEKVFDLLLVTAIKYNIPQDELPNKILVISDMEFDRATNYNKYNCDGDHMGVMSAYNTLFETIKGRWTAAGYTMPGIVFWNVNSRTNTIPVSSNECGVTLVSGFSPNIVKMIISGEIDPWNSLKAVLDSPRYDAIAEALKN